MKKIFILIISLIMASYVLAASDYVTLSGKIKNQNSDKITVRVKEDHGYYNNVKEINLKKDGSFSDTLKVSTGYYNIYDGSESTEMYLKNRYSINLTLDSKEFDETIKYAGIGSAPNNYLAKKYLIYENTDKNFKFFFGLDEKGFIKKLDSLKSSLESELAKVKNEDAFVKNEKKRMKYDYFIRLQNYQRYHRYVTHNHDFNVSNNFLTPLKNVDIDNIKDFNSIPEYSSFLTEYIIGSLQEGKKDEIIAKLLNIKHKKIKDFLIQGLNIQLSPKNDANEAVYLVLLKLVKDEKALNSINKRYSIIKKISKGNASPQFSYKDINDKTISLKNLTGNYVYIDVWATWCAPCRGEIPSLKKMEEEYSDKPIKFVSISVDSKKDFDKWKNFVKENDLKGLQLYADKSWKSNFMRQYLVESIPRFILLDKKGKIIDSDATRPSNPQLKNQLDKLLK